MIHYQMPIYPIKLTCWFIRQNILGVNWSTGIATVAVPLQKVGSLDDKCGAPSSLFPKLPEFYLVFSSSALSHK